MKQEVGKSNPSIILKAFIADFPAISDQEKKSLHSTRSYSEADFQAGSQGKFHS